MEVREYLSNQHTHYSIGLDVMSLANNGRYKPISRVTLFVDEENYYTAGDDTGREISASCPSATQEIADNLLAQLSGYEYQAYEAGKANIDPASELGDGVSVGEIYGTIARFNDDGNGYPDISAPGEAELDEEYPYLSPMKQEMERQSTQLRSLITKTASEITLQVEDLSKDLGQTLRIAADGVTITNAQGSTLKIDGGQIDATTINVNDLNLSGRIAWADLDSDAQTEINDAYSMALAADSAASDAQNTAETVYSEFAQVKMTVGGQTYIDGSMIYTNTIYADALHLGGNLTVYSAAYGNAVGGYLGYTSSAQDGSAGIHLQSGSGQVVATSNGAKLLYGASNQVYIASARCGVSINGANYYFEYTNGFYSGNTAQLGTASAKWGQIYSTNSVISTSDREEKNSINYDIDPRFDVLWANLKPCTGKFNNGTSGRTHMFLIAQDVEAAIETAGLTSTDFAAFIKSPKEDEDGNVIDGVYIYGLRYEEFIPLCIRRIQMLEARVAEVEGT